MDGRELEAYVLSVLVYCSYWRGQGCKYQLDVAVVERCKEQMQEAEGSSNHRELENAAAFSGRPPHGQRRTEGDAEWR